MYEPIEIPPDAVMLFNKFQLKEGVTVDDVELAIGEMCNVVKNTYGDEKGGFIAGQVFKFSGFVSDEGSVGGTEGKGGGEHIAIVTYWKSFKQHEQSHANQIFKEKFSGVAQYAAESSELGYELLWQGTPE